jgi:hypothetical protein
LALIAAGLTNKEMAYRLRITERGAAAHVSRLLSRFGVPNRAGLVASTLAESRVNDTIADERAAYRPKASIQGLDVRVFDESAFFITITLGRDHVIAYQNKATQRLISGIAAESMATRADRERRFPDQTAKRMRNLADDTVARGVTAIADGMPVFWMNDDGSSEYRTFDWVLQPLLGDGGAVDGLLWIGTFRKFSEGRAPGAPR